MIGAQNPVFSIEIPGRPISKKNTKKVVRRYGVSRVIYSPQFREWEKQALIYLKHRAQIFSTIDYHLMAKFVFNFKDHRSEADVSNLIEAPQDALEKAGVIKNDRLIQMVHARKEFGKKESTLIELYRIVVHE